MRNRPSIPPYLDNERKSSKTIDITQLCDMAHQFKPFDQVLVRDDEECNWKIGIYSHYEEDYGMAHVCAGSRYQQCIPYNENTAYLLGTNKPYKEPEPKVWTVTCHKNNERFHFTNDELKHFVENAVINNKDIQWFTLTYDENNN